ncbi:MAG: pilin [Pseudomonadota bacterium]
MIRHRLAAIYAAVIVAIGLLTTPSLHASPSAEQWNGQLPIHEPWLRESMPDNVLAYVRIPNIYGLMSVPKGNVLDPALRSTANVESVEALRNAISNNVLPLIPGFDTPTTQLLEKHIVSPIEIAVTLDAGPTALLGMTLDVESRDDFAEMLALMGVPTIEPLDANGSGALAGMPMPAFVNFNENSGRLLLFGGPAASLDGFNAAQSGMVRDSKHRMRTSEDRIDESGQGFFFWIDSERALPLMQATLPPDQVETFTELGLDRVSTFSWGWGVADGKGRLKIAADLIEGNSRGYVPLIKNDISAMSVGNPDGLFLISLPSVEEFRRIESLALVTADAESQETWETLKNGVTEFLGFSLEDIFVAFGPEFLFVLDQAGDYSAVRIRDKDRWQYILDQIEETAGISPDERRINGRTYYHLSVGNELSMLDDEQLDENIGWVGVLFARQRDHVYWTEEGDYLYTNTTPQVLIDRANAGPDTSIAAWLETTQRTDLNESVFAISGTTRKLPKRLYASYLEVLHILTDIAQSDFDMWSMPTADQLRLPDIGTLGFSVNLGEPTLSMEMVYENNPAEMLGGLGGIFVAGMMAAIAVPAYQDYTVRAQISAGINLSAAQKAGVVEIYQDKGRFPNAEEAEQLSSFDTGNEYVASIVVEANTGAIIVEYYEAVGGGGELYLDPTPTNGSVIWNCSATYEDKHVPAACRNSGTESY